MEPIAHIRTQFPTKFGIPRQAGLVPELTGEIIFEPAYRNPDALRGLEGFSHLWLLWEFSEAKRTQWSPTVRPPRLGGNVRMGVFATRSPFRPNPIGLSCVKLEGIGLEMPSLLVSGADLMDGTPIFDIKPYLPYCDCHPEATGGFTATHGKAPLEVVFPPETELPPHVRTSLYGVLAQDPRPQYQSDSSRVYGFSFAGYGIRFRVEKNILTVLEVFPD